MIYEVTFEVDLGPDYDPEETEDGNGAQIVLPAMTMLEDEARLRGKLTSTVSQYPGDPTIEQSSRFARDVLRLMGRSLGHSCSLEEWLHEAAERAGITERMQ